MIQEDAKSNKMWRYINSKRCDSVGVAPQKKNGVIYSDATAKATILEEQFSSVFTDEDATNMPNLEPSPHPDMPDINISTHGIKKLLERLNPRKATGPDNIPCRLLVAVAQELAPALELLFRMSLKTGEIPAVCKHALVQPVYKKKGSRNLPSNYRPISLTSVCGKVMEHIVRHAITAHLHENKIMVDAQHGFRKGRSCETQLILTVDDLSSTLDKSGQTDTILLDFSKAFDKVPHQRLLLKLEHYGIRGQTLKWIQSFLTDRTQQVVVEGKTSPVGKVTSGVPQGSVLGPTLFLVYINDLGKNIKSTVRLFADDTILYRKIQNHNDAALLQQDLEELERWERDWQMLFNADKCFVLPVTRKHNPIKSTYSLHNQNLEEVKSSKYLGVELTKTLNWGDHVAAVCEKANNTSAFIARNLQACPPTVQAACYKSLVRPTLEYACPVWDPHQEELISDLEMIQRRSARRIFRDFSRTTSATALVNRLNLDPLKLRHTSAKATLMYKVEWNCVDVKPRDGVLRRKGRNLRGHSYQYLQLHCDSESHSSSFFPSAIRLWNNLPEEAVKASSPQQCRALFRIFRMCQREHLSGTATTVK
jgi:hypothetical protein